MKNGILSALFLAGALALAAEPPAISNWTPKAPAKVKQPMRMDEPMPIGMKREGMMKGDVKKAAEKKAAEMKPLMEREERAMPAGGAKK